MGENKINTINLNDIFQDVKTDLIGNLLNETKDSKKCMWYLICALDGMGDQEILELSGYTNPQIQMLKKQVMDVVKENRDVRSSVEAGLDKAIQEQIEKSNKLIEAKDEMITMINMQKVDLQRQNEELKAKVNELEKQSTSVVAATSNPADRKDAETQIEKQLSEEENIENKIEVRREEIQPEERKKSIGKRIRKYLFSSKGLSVGVPGKWSWCKRNVRICI